MSTATAEPIQRTAKQIAASNALSAVKRARVQAELMSSLVGPLKIGDRAMCGYWHASYTLIAMHYSIDGQSMPAITVRWDARRDRPEHETTHSTSWDWKRDVKLVSESELS